jgi:pyrroline-5-carboxylate reductase
MTLSLAGPLLLVGAGKMGGALLEGWLRQGLDPASVFIQDPAPPSPELDGLIARHGIEAGSAPELPAAPTVILLAVKPDIVQKLLPEVEPLMGEKTVVLSIAAGRTLASLARALPPGVAIVRAMPNTAASVGHSVTVACANEAVTRHQALECNMLLEAVGEVIWIEDESLMDAVTAVSGSGPAYVFLLAECLAEAGRAAGLDPELASHLARATVEGAGELLRRSDLSPAELRASVTSPKGTTAAALEVLMGKDGFHDLLARAVAAAAKRSGELSS